MRWVCPALVAAALWGCGGTEPEPAPRRAAPPPPDAGSQRGHGADPATVRVPDSDRTPPRATVDVETDERGFTVTATGSDLDSGVARVRVSVKERLACRHADGRSFVRARQRYFPPPQIERIRSAPGARLPTRASRRRRLRMPESRCGTEARLESATLEAWGEATNGLGLEAVTDHRRARLTRTRRP